MAGSSTSSSKKLIKLPDVSMNQARAKHLQETVSASFTPFWLKTKPNTNGEAQTSSIKASCTLVQDCVWTVLKVFTLAATRKLLLAIHMAQL
ncbi:hypothetical protein J1N35_007718 [Gossypium stocksii]|uniref:Uncharacterized protein n=1 Tax=Gossypium stocksii TaxID=47602 RepID=A0A9D3W9Q3_9ROSI|nr:hypothetical protein J1N35_007718 [Gossypium stocksii]